MNLSVEQLDGLKELINVGIGKGASVLNTMLDAHIRLQVPEIKLVTPSELDEEVQSLTKLRLAGVTLPFSGKLHGSAQLLFPLESAHKLVAALTDDDPGSLDMDSMWEGTLNEIGNIVLNGVMGTVSNVLNFPLKYAVPRCFEAKPSELLDHSGVKSDPVVLLAHTHFAIEKLRIEGDVALFFEVTSFDALVAAIEARAAAGISYG
jgi:chemotaxis protein CheC